MSKELEARLLASVPTVGQFQNLEELGISEGSFKFYGPMYRYIDEVVREHNHLPRLVDLRATFNVPDHVQRKPQEYEWLLDEFLRLTTVERIQEVMDRDVEQYGEDPRNLLPALIKDLTSLALPNERFASITDMSIEERLARYSQQRDDALIMGIPTGIRYFDSEYQLGWLPGELIGIIARPYVGKSWMLVYHGLMAWLCHKRILFLSPEMPKEEAEARIDAAYCGLHDIPIDVTDLYRGIKPTAKQQELLRKMADRGDWVTLTSDQGKPFRLGEIPRHIRQFSPDLILIDGLLLVNPDKRGQAFEQVKDLSYGLKNIAVGHNVAILVVHQANRNASNMAKPPGLHEIYMGDAFVQACDRVLVLSQPSKPPHTLRVTVQKFRKGQPLHKGTDFEFLPGMGKIRERDEYPGATDGSGDNGATVQERAGAEDLLSIP